MLLLVSLAAPALGGGLRAADVHEVVEAIRASRLEPERAVDGAGVEIAVGSGRLVVARGTLIPATPVAGRSLEFAFVGEARLVLEPADAIEASQMELFSGTPTLDLELREAVILLGSEERSRALAARPAAAVDADALSTAESLYRDWLGRTERRTRGAELGLFRAAFRDPPFARYQGLFCRGTREGDLFLEVDPEDSEPIAVGQFVPWGAQTVEQRRVARYLRAEQRRGRWIGLRLEDLGVWDVWTSTEAPAERGGPFGGEPTPEPLRYDLDVEIEPNLRWITARAAVELQHRRPGRTSVVFELHADLEVRRVTDEAGRPLAHVRSGGRVIVALAEPSEAGRIDRVVFVYEGAILRSTEGRRGTLRDTVRWYPRCAAEGRPRYDVAYRWPARVGLVAGGSRVAGGVDGGTRWERRHLESPGIGVAFEVGDFETVAAAVGVTQVEIAFARDARGLPRRAVRRDTVETVREAVEFYTRLFGPLPGGRLAVVASPREMSQSFPGFVLLADELFAAEVPEGPAELARRRGVIAHEIAHQWWGNFVGWRSYRDQWLSEAMASYAAVLFLDHDAGGASPDFLARLASGWRDSLAASLPDGRTIESVGPLVLGERLVSSKGGDAYSAIVYRKGAAVLAMMARTVGEERFAAALRGVLAEPAGRKLSTEEFLDAVTRATGTDLGAFGERFVFGTGIPDVIYEAGVAEDDAGGWLISGRVWQSVPPRVTFRARRLTGNGWDVVRTPSVRGDGAVSPLSVPVRVEQEPGDPVETTVTLADGDRSFALTAPRRPVAVAFDPRGEVLARFLDFADPDPAVRRAVVRALRARGDDTAAERLLTSSIADRARPFPSDRFELARLLLDGGRDAEARAQLRALQREFGPTAEVAWELDLEALRARLELRAGQAEDAFERLRAARDGLMRRERGYPAAARGMRPPPPSRETVSELVALYAVAAWGAGRADPYREILPVAELYGCDLSEIEP